MIWRFEYADGRYIKGEVPDEFGPWFERTLTLVSVGLIDAEILLAFLDPDKSEAH